MTPSQLVTVICCAVAALAIPAGMLVTWLRHARRRSRLNSLAHQAEGPYRKVGERRRK